MCINPPYPIENWKEELLTEDSDSESRMSPQPSHPLKKFKNLGKKRTFYGVETKQYSSWGRWLRTQYLLTLTLTDSGFPRWGSNSKCRGTNLFFCHYFFVNCMKMILIGSVGDRVSGTPSIICQWFLQTVRSLLFFCTWPGKRNVSSRSVWTNHQWVEVSLRDVNLFLYNIITSNITSLPVKAHGYMLRHFFCCPRK